MKTFSTVEDYLEVISGKRDIAGVVVTHAWMGPQFSPVINLARYDTQFLDNVTDATLGNIALTDRQADLGLRLIFKYQRQLAAKGISIEPMAAPRYRIPLRYLDRTKRCYLEDNQLVLRFPYDAKSIQEFRDLLKSRQGAAAFNKETKSWHIDLSEYNVNFAVAWAKSKQFEISDELEDLMNQIIQVEQEEFSICLDRVQGKLELRNAAPSLLEYLDNLGLDLTDDHLVKLADLSSTLGYEVSAQVWQEVENIVGSDLVPFMRSRNYEILGDYNQLERLIRYAILVNRLPLVVFDPSSDGLSRYQTLVTDEHIFKVQNNKNIDWSSVKETVIYTHKPIKDLDSIPLLVSHIGMVAGIDRQYMIQSSEKIIYFNRQLTP